MRHIYRVTLSLTSGELHELRLTASSRAYVDDLAIAALDIYNATSATVELLSSPPRSGAQVRRPYWLH